MEIVKKMSDVHKIAEFDLDAAVQSREVVKEILKDEYGKEIAYAVYYLKQPLAKISDLTRLQKMYLIYSKGEIRNVGKKSSYVLSGQKMTVKELLEMFK